MQIIIQTQYRENYGAHAWDGEGECPQYWKNKGGFQYVIEGVDPNSDLNKVVEEGVARLGCEHSDNYSEEFVISWMGTNDGELTQDEQQQMEWDGKITYPSKRVVCDW